MMVRGPGTPLPAIIRPVVGAPASAMDVSDGVSSSTRSSNRNPWSSSSSPSLTSTSTSSSSSSSTSSSMSSGVAEPVPLPAYFWAAPMVFVWAAPVNPEVATLGEVLAAGLPEDGQEGSLLDELLHCCGCN